MSKVRKEKLTKLIELIHAVGRLKRTPRIGWLITGVSKSHVESVAEHTLRTAIITMLIVDLLKNENFKVDEVKALKMSLIHDLPEVLLQDIGKEAQYFIGEDFKMKVETKAFKKLLTLLPEPLREEYLNLWREFTDEEVLETQIVKFADKIEMFMQALEYEQIGYNPEIFEHFWRKFPPLKDKCKIDLLRDLFAQLDAMRKK